MAQAVDPRDQLIAELETKVAWSIERVAKLEAENAELRGPSGTELPELLEAAVIGSSRSGAPAQAGYGPQAGRATRGQGTHTKLVPVEQVDQGPRASALHLLPLRASDDPTPLQYEVTRGQVHRDRVTGSTRSLASARDHARAWLTAGVPRGAFGPVLASMVALCTIRFRQPKRRAQELLSTMLNGDVSLGVTDRAKRSPVVRPS